jgi:hypothetical protein
VGVGLSHAGLRRRRVRVLQLVDPAFQAGEAGLEVELHQAAAGVDGQQRRLARHMGDQHHLDGLQACSSSLTSCFIMLLMGSSRP